MNDHNDPTWLADLRTLLVGQTITDFEIAPNAYGQHRVELDEELGAGVILTLSSGKRVRFSGWGSYDDYGLGIDVVEPPVIDAEPNPAVMAALSTRVVKTAIDNEVRRIKLNEQTGDQP